MGCLDDIIAEIKKEKLSERDSDILFVQQAFLIAHEMYHYSVNKNPGTEIRELDSEKSYLKFL